VAQIVKGSNNLHVFREESPLLAVFTVKQDVFLEGELELELQGFCGHVTLGDGASPCVCH